MLGGFMLIHNEADINQSDPFASLKKYNEALYKSLEARCNYSDNKHQDNRLLKKVTDILELGDKLLIGQASAKEYIQEVNNFHRSLSILGYDHILKETFPETTVDSNNIQAVGYVIENIESRVLLTALVVANPGLKFNNLVINYDLDKEKYKPGEEVEAKIYLTALAGYDSIRYEANKGSIISKEKETPILKYKIPEDAEKEIITVKAETQGMTLMSSFQIPLD